MKRGRSKTKGPLLCGLWRLHPALIDSLWDKEGFSIHFFNRVQDLRRDGDLWSARVKDEQSGERRDVQAKFVFIGAGGVALLLENPGYPKGMASLRQP